MTRLPAIRITLACAYCATPIDFHQGAIELRARGGALLREGTFTTIECPHCDSKFTVDITTKRKRKGRRLKAIEAERARLQGIAVEQRRAENSREGADLCAEPGCTCGPEIERRRTNGYTGIHDNGKDTGHPLSTGWSRDSKTGAMLPTKPQHMYGCPKKSTNTPAALYEEI